MSAHPRDITAWLGPPSGQDCVARPILGTALPSSAHPRDSTVWLGPFSGQHCQLTFSHGLRKAFLFLHFREAVRGRSS